MQAWDIRLVNFKGNIDISAPIANLASTAGSLLKLSFIRYIELFDMLSDVHIPITYPNQARTEMLTKHVNIFAPIIAAGGAVAAWHLFPTLKKAIKNYNKYKDEQHPTPETKAQLEKAWNEIVSLASFLSLSSISTAFMAFVFIDSAPVSSSPIIEGSLHHPVASHFD